MAARKPPPSAFIAAPPSSVSPARHCCSPLNDTRSGEGPGCIGSVRSGLSEHTSGRGVALTGSPIAVTPKWQIRLPFPAGQRPRVILERVDLSPATLVELLPHERLEFTEALGG